MNENKPPVVGWLMLAVFVTSLIITNIAVFLMLPFSTAMAFCVMVDVFFVIIVRPVRQ